MTEKGCCWANRPIKDKAHIEMVDGSGILFYDAEVMDKWLEGFGVQLDKAKQALDEAVKDHEHVHDFVRIDKELWERLVEAVQKL